MSNKPLSKGQFEGIHKELMSGGTENDSGFTAHVFTGERVAPGDAVFMVSHPNTEQKIPQSTVTPRDIVHYARGHKEQLGRTDEFLGGWKPEAKDSPDVSLDRSQAIRYTPQHSNPKLDPEHGNALTSAMDLAHARNQESVYDAAENRVISNPTYRKQ